MELFEFSFNVTYDNHGYHITDAGGGTTPLLSVFDSLLSQNLEMFIHHLIVARLYYGEARLPALLTYYSPPMKSLLHTASERGLTTFAKLLLDYGADVNAPGERGETALMCACEHAHLATVSLLVSRGAEMDRKAGGGRSLLMVAAGKGGWEVLLELLDAKEEVPGGWDLGQMDDLGRTVWEYIPDTDRGRLVRGVLERYDAGRLTP